MKIVLFVLLLLVSPFVHAQKYITFFEKSNEQKTPEYHQIIEWWKMMDEQFPQIKMQTMGETDAGFPLHLIIVSNDRDFNFASLQKKNKRVIFINNGIHPGEPDGIDASMLLVRDIVTGKNNLPSNVVLAIIPVYNIGGCLNRSANYRVDQNGPEEFGFRGNSRNFDLNRDFIKCDTKEARSFAEIFHLINPDVFVDNHVSDGADYQHIMTLIASQHNKLGGEMGKFMNKTFAPEMYTLMEKKGFDLVPYVNFFGDIPDNGWSEFFDSPRYSSGYATLWHVFGFTPETHMLKPYGQRVKATYALMESFITFTSKHSDEIRSIRKRTIEQSKTQAEFPVNWELNPDKFSTIQFHGYEAGHKTSEVSGLPRLYYDRSKPFEKEVKFYNEFEPSVIIKKPAAYIIPQGWWNVIDLLKLNKVNLRRLAKDTSIEVQVYRIRDYSTAPKQYEGHHPNNKVSISDSMQVMKFRKGDYYIPMNQEANRFLMEVLEPQGEDSYFSWNFFDAILGQKEGISDYVFEETAAQYLKANPEARKQLEEKKRADTAFAKSASAQLRFVFRHSPYFEPGYLRYPVYRVLK